MAPTSETLFNALVTIAIVVCLYFLPYFVAKNRKHVNTTAIGVLNLLLGWTIIGWVIALVWASTANIEKDAKP